MRQSGSALRKLIRSVAAAVLRHTKLSPGCIVPVLADQGLFIDSESSFYWGLHAYGQVHHRLRSGSDEVDQVSEEGAIAVNTAEVSHGRCTIGLGLLKPFR